MKKNILIIIVVLGVIVVTKLIINFNYANSSYINIYQEVKKLPIKELIGWRFAKREDENVYLVRYLYCNSDTSILEPNFEDSICEISFICSYTSFNRKLALTDEQYNLQSLQKYADLLNMPYHKAKSSLNQLFKLFKDSEAKSIRSSPLPSDFVILTFGEDEKMVLTYVTDSISFDEREGLGLNDCVKIDKNWYYFECKK
jgi:hypothetical protein